MSGSSWSRPVTGLVPGAAEHPGWLDPLLAGCVDGRFHDLLPVRRPPEGDGVNHLGRPLRDSAVLVLLSGDPGASGETPPPGANVLLTHRAPTLSSHSGQVAFPGGAADPEDAGPVGTALREAQEETGLAPTGVDALAVTPSLYIPASNYSVYPVLGYWRQPMEVGVVDPAETARVMAVPLDELLDPANRFLVRHPSGWQGPAFHLDDLVLWGFTSGILSAMFYVAGWEREWDTTDVRDLETTLAESGNGEPPTPLSTQIHREAVAAQQDRRVAGVPSVTAHGENIGVGEREAELAKPEKEVRR